MNRQKLFRTIGIILITASLAIGGWIFYQYVISSNLDANDQIKTVSTITLPDIPSTDSTDVKDFIPEGDVFAKMFVPVWGDTWVRPVVQGTTDKDLWNGVGHYNNSVLPGMIGNFAVASHRTVSGSNFKDIHTLKKGDKIYFQTIDGFYEYTFTNSIIVKPTEAGVLAPRPESIDASVEVDKFLTMTTCDPIWGNTDRFIAYSIFTKFYPNGNPPADIIRMSQAIQ